MHRHALKGQKKHTRTQWSKSGGEVQGNQPRAGAHSQTPNATANSKTHKNKTATNAGEPHPEPHKPAAHAHKLRAVFLPRAHCLRFCRRSFLRYYYLYCSSILYFALYIICHCINYIRTIYYNYLL
nr:MAG TPA: hypothetical protein [Caudoviricetes sp.]